MSIYHARSFIASTSYSEFERCIAIYRFELVYVLFSLSFQCDSQSTIRALSVLFGQFSYFIDGLAIDKEKSRNMKQK